MKLIQGFRPTEAADFAVVLYKGLADITMLSFTHSFCTKPGFVESPKQACSPLPQQYDYASINDAATSPSSLNLRNAFQKESWLTHIYINYLCLSEGKQEPKPQGQEPGLKHHQIWQFYSNIVLLAPQLSGWSLPPMQRAPSSTQGELGTTVGHQSEPKMALWLQKNSCHGPLVDRTPQDW